MNFVHIGNNFRLTGLFYKIFIYLWLFYILKMRSLPSQEAGDGVLDSCKPMAYNKNMNTSPPISVIETPSFLRDAKKHLTDDERKNVVSFLAYNPAIGDLIQGTGGVRKVRWAREDGGKSGGFRVIYFYHSPGVPLFVLNLFAKNEQANLSQADRNALQALSATLVARYKKGDWS